jgi:hypothetical protein
MDLKISGRTFRGRQNRARRKKGDSEENDTAKNPSHSAHYNHWALYTQPCCNGGTPSLTRRQELLGLSRESERLVAQIPLVYRDPIYKDIDCASFYGTRVEDAMKFKWAYNRETVD